MREYLDQVRRAAASDLYYLTLEATLVIPDMCTGLEAPDGRATAELYVAWFDTWMAPRYVAVGIPTFSGEDCYGLRCAMLHQGRLSPHRGSYQRVVFLEPHGDSVFHNNVFGDVLNLDVTRFAADMAGSAEQWLSYAEATETYRANFPNFMQRYPQGLPPYILSLPVIA